MPSTLMRLVVIFATLPNAYGASTDPFYGAMRYATPGTGKNDECPPGTTAATQAQCDQAVAALAASTTSTKTADEDAIYQELLAILGHLNPDTPSEAVFGYEALASSYYNPAGSYSNKPKGCHMSGGSTVGASDEGHLYFNTHGTGGTWGTRAPICMQNAWIAGDPHISFAHGGKADLRGEDGKHFVIHSAPNASLAMMTTHTHFLQKHGAQKVHGSHFTAATAVLRTNTTGKLVSITVDAAVTPWFAPYAAVVVSGAAPGTKPLKVAFRGDKSKTVPSFAVEDVSVTATSRTALTIAGDNWEYKLVRRILFKPLFGSKSHYLNVGVTPVRADPTNAHGILGQSFGFGKKVDGKLDDYNGTEVTTSAQAEGAIEGVYTDYKVDNPFNTSFKYSRFDAPATTSPRLAAVGAVPLSAGADDTPVEEA